MVVRLPPPDAGPDGGDAGDDGGLLAGPAGFQDVDQVSMGSRHACLLSGGAAYCWGANVSGNLGTGDTTSHPAPFQVVAGLPDAGGLLTVVAGDDQTCVLAPGGQPYCWGADTYSSNGDPFPAHQVCNSNYCNPTPLPVQLEVDGGVLPDGGFVGPGTPLTGMQTLYGGEGFTCALDPSGKAYCWGTETNTPTIAQEAVSFVNQNGALPSGPMSKIASSGQGFYSAVNYLTASGQVIEGTTLVTQVCP
jgi:alpha-tubulin suppressor-like RCC1 family protein